MNTRGANKLKILIARSNIAFLILMTAFNIWLILRASSWNLPYSSEICSYTVAMCKSMTDLEGAGKSIIYFGVALSAVILAFLAVCYFKSKKDKKWLNAALYFIIVDTVAVVYLLIDSVFFKSNFSAAFLIDFIMHALMIYYVARGARAGNAGDEEADADDGDGNEYADELYSDEEPDEAVEEYDENAKKVFELITEHNGHILAGALYGGDLVFAIDGYIVDSEPFEPKYDYRLEAECGGIGYTLFYDDYDQLLAFYADEDIIDSRSV